MSISDFFSSIFGKTHKTKRFRGKQSRKRNILNKKHKGRFMKGAMKGGWGGAVTPPTPVVPLMKGGMKGVMKGGWGGAIQPVV